MFVVKHVHRARQLACQPSKLTWQSSWVFMECLRWGTISGEAKGCGSVLVTTWLCVLEDKVPKEKVAFGLWQKTMKKMYKILPRDSMSALERKLNALLLSLTREGVIPATLYNRLCSSVGKILLLYGLPKLHKPEIPLWPIVSFLNSPTYKLPKHLVSIFSLLVGRSNSHIKNSSNFASFIAGQTLSSEMLLASFDIVSLFMKVPADLAYGQWKTQGWQLIVWTNSALSR